MEKLNANLFPPRMIIELLIDFQASNSEEKVDRIAYKNIHSTAPVQCTTFTLMRDWHSIGLFFKHMCKL